MTKKELLIFWVLYVLTMPIALDFMRGVYIAWGWIK